MEKCVTVRKPKVFKAVIICDSNYSTNKETRKDVSGLVTTLGLTLLTSYKKTQRTIKISSTEVNYIALSAYA